MEQQILNLPFINELENRRKKYLIKMFAGVILSLFILLLSFYLIFISSSLSAILTIIGLICLFNIPNSCCKNYSTELKNIYLPRIMPMIPYLKWDKKGISSDILEKSCLFGVINEVNVDDYFEGVHNNVKFEIAETEIFEIDRAYDSYRQVERKDYYQVFKGVIILFPANKSIKSLTMVTTKKDSNINFRSKALIPYLSFIIGLTIALICAIFFATDNNTARIIAVICASVIPIFGTCYYIKKRTDNKNQQFFDLKNDKLELEDIKFSKRFNVYSKDEVEGRYLVTPAFMERFNNLTTAFGTNKAKCSFFEDKVMFAISTNKNLFEVGNLFTSLKNPKNLQKFFDELNSILKMVEYFKLDEHTKI